MRGQTMAVDFRQIVSVVASMGEAKFEKQQSARENYHRSQYQQHQKVID